MTKGLRKESYCTNYLIILEKDFQENTQKIQKLMFSLAQTSYFGCGISSPPYSPQVPTSYSHI